MAQTIYLFAEEVGTVADEAYAKVVHELSRALASRSGVITHTTPTPTAPMSDSWSAALRRAVRRMVALFDRAMWREIRRERPGTLVYLSRSSATVAALVRGRVLRTIAGRARLVMIGLQPRKLGRAGGVAARLLWPDLLLLSTDSEVRAARALGARADRMIVGVDVERFRPPFPGEKSALRAKWGMPDRDKVILHVGHLTAGRNLEALVPLARQSEWQVLMVASSQEVSESATLERMLRDGGVHVLRGFLPDIGELYRLADCYVFPTVSSDHAIALPLSVLEALATNLPVAAMRFGALAERFDAAPGITLVRDSADLTAAVARLLHGHAKTRGLVDGFTWDAIAAHVEAAAR